MFAMTTHLSTGPTSPEGKLRSSQNARTHGLSAQTLKISSHDQPTFDSLKSALSQELQPLGELEHSLFDRILTAQWKLRTIDSLEADLLNAFDPLNDSHSITLNRFSLYRSRTENGLYKALNELRHLQEERHLRAAALDQPRAFSPIVRVAQVQRSFVALNRVKKQTPPNIIQAFTRQHAT